MFGHRNIRCITSRCMNKPWMAVKITLKLIDSNYLLEHVIPNNEHTRSSCSLDTLGSASSAGDCSIVVPNSGKLMFSDWQQNNIPELNMFTHLRFRQHCFFFPVPPNFFLSLQTTVTTSPTISCHAAIA